MLFEGRPSKTESGGFHCDMKAMTREERHRYEILRTRLEAAVAGVEELADRYSLQLRGGAIPPHEVAEWVAFKKKCCPFFALETDGQADSPKLRITGRAGVKNFIRPEFSAIRFE
jgi:hypothetical protein